MKTYPEYKDSNLPWLGRIPTEWNLKRAKWYLKSKKEINTDGSCRDVLSLTLRGVVDNDPDKPEGLVPNDYRSYQIFEKNNLVFKLIDLENYKTSRVGLVHRRGIMSPAYIRVIVDSPDLSPKFYYYFYYSLYLQGVYNKIGAGVRATLSAKRLLDLPIPIPEKQEQDKISFFLDRKLNQIAKFIRNKRRLIQLLQEQKQAIINQAVTRGINPNVRLKPSGVDYLGGIPEHWEVLPIKRALSSMTYGILERARDVGEYRVLGMGHIKDGNVKVENCGRIDNVPFDLILEKDDLLFNRTNSRELVGKVGIFTGDKANKVTFASYLVRMKVNKKVFPRYMNYILNSYNVISVARQNAIPSLHQSNLNATRYGRLLIPLPPKREQKDILAYIETKCSIIDVIIMRAKQEIDLIREYRTRLISDVVTGKIDVRNIPVEPIEESQSDEGLDMVEEEQMQEELENFEEKTYENL